MDKRLLITASGLILILVILTVSVVRIGSRQERNFESLLAEVRGNADQIQQMDRVFRQVGEDASEVREALLMDPVHYSVTPYISPEDQRGDRFGLFIRAFETFEKHYTENTYAVLLDEILSSSRFKEFVSTHQLELSIRDLEFTLSGTLEETGPIVFFSGVYGPNGVMVQSPVTGEERADIDNAETLVSFLEKEYETIESAADRYRQFLASYRDWMTSPEISGFLDDKKIVFELQEEDPLNAVLQLRTSDYRPLATLRYNPDGDLEFLDNEYKSFEAFKDSFREIIDAMDTRSFGELKTEKNIAAMKATLQDAEFRSILEAYDMKIKEVPREDPDFYYFDIEKKNSAYGSFGILKEHGDLYIMDTDDVPISSLESLDIQQVLNDTEAAESNEEDISFDVSDEDYDTILLCGSHEKNPDTMILLIAKKESNQTYMFSLPRDLFYKGQKINNIYRHFGPEQLLKDISSITGLSVNKYISIDMYAFIDVINILGGVDVTLAEPLIDPTHRIKENGIWKTLHYSRGTHHLDGLGALRVARSRHTSSDFDRAERQQLIIASLMKKLKNISDAATMYKLLNSAFRYVSTNITPVDAVELAVSMKNADIMGKYVLSTNNVLYHTTSASGLWILLPEDDNWNTIADYIHGKIQ